MHTKRVLGLVEDGGSVRRRPPFDAPRILGALASVALLGAMVFAGIGEPGAVAIAATIDPTATTVFDPTATTQPVTTTTLDPTVTTLATATTTTLTPATTLPPGPRCLPNGSDCVRSVVATAVTDVNASGTVDHGDIINVEATVSALGPGLTSPTLVIPLMAGVGHGFVAGSLTLDGVPVGPGGGGFSSTAATVTLPSPLPAVSVVGLKIVLGSFVPPAPRTAFGVVSDLTGTDVNRLVVVRAVGPVVTFVQPVADLDLTLTVTSRPTAGGLAGVQADITNAGLFPATASQVSLQLPSVADLTKVQAPVGCTTSVTGLVTCPLGTLAPAAKATIAVSFPFTIAAPRGVPASVTASALTSTLETNAANNAASASVALDLSDVSVSFLGVGSTAVAGAPLPFVIHVSNAAGGTDAHGVNLVANLPVALRPITPPAGCEFVLPAGPFRCLNFTIPVGGFVDFDLSKGIVNYQAVGTRLDFSAEVTLQDAGADPNTANNTVVPFSIPVLGTTELSVTFTSSPTSVTAGQPVVLSLAAANAGLSVSRDVDVLVTLDQSLNGLNGTIAGTPCATLSATAVLCKTTGLDPDSMKGPVAITVGGSIPPNANYDSVTGVAKITSASPAVTDQAPFDNNTATAVIAVKGLADVRVSVKGLSNALAGQVVTYEVTVTNAGPSDAVGTTIGLGGDAVGGLGPASDDPLTCRADGADLSCGSFTLAVGASRTFVISGRIAEDAALNASATLRATVSAKTIDPDATNNVASASTSVTLAPELSVSAASSPVTAVTAGEAVSYRITISNGGKTRTDGATLEISRPDFFGGGSPQGAGVSCADVGAGWSCSVRAIYPNSPVVVTLAGTVAASSAAASTMLLVARATDVFDRSVHSVDVSLTVQVVAKVTMTAGPEQTITAGNAFDLTFGLTNNGPSDAQNVTVSIDLPSGARLDKTDTCVLSGSTVKCLIGRMTSGLTQPLSLHFISNADAVDETLLRYAYTTTWNDTAPTTGVRVVTLQSRADLEVQWSSPPKAVAGTRTSTTITITNHGPSLSRNVTSELGWRGPAKTMTVSPVTKELTCKKRDDVTLLCDPISLGPGASITMDVVVQAAPDAPDPSTITGEIVLKSVTTDLVEANNHTTIALAVTAEANLSVAVETAKDMKSGMITPVKVTVSNRGPSVALNVDVQLNAPANLTSLFVSSAGLDCQRDGGLPVLKCVVGTLRSDTQVVLQLQAVVDTAAETGAGEVFRATVSSGTLDPQPDSNAMKNDSTIVGRATSRKEVTDPDVLTRLNSTLVLDSEVKNPTQVLASNIFFTQDIPLGQRLVAATVSKGHCGLSLRMVLCYVGEIAPDETIRVTVTTVVTEKSESKPVITMAAYSSNASPTNFAVEEDSFVRPAVEPTPDLVVTSTSSPLAPAVTTANAPLLSGLGLSVLFGLGLVGWVRRGRREDPLMAVG